MNPNVAYLIQTYRKCYREHFGRKAYIPRKKKTNESVATESFSGLLGFLTSQGMNAETYFAAVFEWFKSKNLDPAKYSASFFASPKLQNIAIFMLERMKKRNRRSQEALVNPLGTLQERIAHDIRMNFHLLDDFLGQWPDPVQARINAQSNLSPYFWCFDSYWGDPRIQAVLPPTVVTNVMNLWVWFLKNPALRQAAQQTYYDEFTKRTLPVHTGLPVQGTDNPA